MDPASAIWGYGFGRISSEMGRKKRERSEEDSVELTLKLPLSVYEKIEEICKREGISPEELITRLVESL